MQPAGPSAHVIGRRATWLLASALSQPLYEHIRAPDGDECGLTGALNDVNSGWGHHLDTTWSLICIFADIIVQLMPLRRTVESRVVEKTGGGAKIRVKIFSMNSMISEKI